MSKPSLFKSLDDFKKNTKFDVQLGLDTRDNVILSLIQKNPDISQEEIAKRIKLSQPSVGVRIRKLHQKGILYTVNGVNFRIVNLYLAKVDINATDTTAIIDELRDCPFFINALITSGRYNLSIFLTATDLKDLEGIVNHHLRGNAKVKEIELNIVISTIKDFIHPLNLEYDTAKKSCNMECMAVFKDKEKEGIKVKLSDD
jgi:DNA-binding Lrp family transcriptional regulator